MEDLQSIRVFFFADEFPEDHTFHVDTTTDEWSGYWQALEQNEQP